MLIIGGGDEGVLKQSSVESVIQYEINEDVIQVSKNSLSGMVLVTLAQS